VHSAYRMLVCTQDKREAWLKDLTYKHSKSIGPPCGTSRCLPNSECSCGDWLNNRYQQMMSVTIGGGLTMIYVVCMELQIPRDMRCWTAPCLGVFGPWLMASSAAGAQQEDHHYLLIVAHHRAWGSWTYRVYIK
jgi:hypothetical protein